MIKNDVCVRFCHLNSSIFFCKFIVMWQKGSFESSLEKRVTRNSYFILSTYEEYEKKILSKKFQKFVTGSSYQGTWSNVDMDGFGYYTLPHGVIYEGSFKNGMFHGKGCMKYPMGQILSGEWVEGNLKTWDYTYSNKSDWNLDKYCIPPDRRFYKSLQSGLEPAPCENLTKKAETPTLPDDYYDVNDGFFSSNTKCVHNTKDLDEVTYIPPSRRVRGTFTIYMPAGAEFVKTIPLVPVYRSSRWIEKRCRKSCVKNVGYRPDLYEYWFSGREKERLQLDMKSKQNGVQNVHFLLTI